jgi:MSHA biogenesis protein MshJ
MKRLWKQYVDRIDAASARERVMIFAAAVVVIVAALNALLIEPELARQKRASKEIAQRQAETKALQAQLEAMTAVRRADPDQAERLRLEDLKKRLGEVETKLVQEQRKFAPPEQIGTILEEMLSRNRKLALVDMRTLPASALTAGADKPAAGKPAPDKPAPATSEKPAAAAAPAAGPGQIYRHGVELTVTGSYLDLLAYLRDLEKLPSQMYWGKLDLSVAAHPKVTLKLSVYTLSLDRAWLRV